MTSRSAHHGKKNDRPIRAAGGVVWRVRHGAVEIAVVHRPRYDDWSLPKGKLDKGESELGAAVREVGEETGAEVAVSRRLPTVSYAADGAPKTVAFWTMRHLAGDFAASDEVDELRWCALPDARRLLTYADEQPVLADFAAVPVPESVIVLVRHARAGKRSEWHGDDLKRPLDARGRSQARRLAGLLPAFAPDRIVSARPLRCRQTVQPLADRLDLHVAVDAAFDDHAFEADPTASEAALLALAKPRRVTVVSSQGTAIPGLLDRALHGSGSSSTRKAAAWVLSLVDGAVVGADYYEDAVH